jgi:hypothetical protein
VYRYLSVFRAVLKMSEEKEQRVLISADIVVILGVHAFRVVSAGFLSGKFSERAVDVKMVGGDNSFVTIVFRVFDIF